LFCCAVEELLDQLICASLHLGLAWCDAGVVD
jgi:hypothetical protein